MNVMLTSFEFGLEKRNRNNTYPIIYKESKLRRLK